MFVTFNMQGILHVDMLTINLRAKFHITNSDCSFLIAIKLGSKENLRTGAILLLYTPRTGAILLLYTPQKHEQTQYPYYSKLYHDKLLQDAKNSLNSAILTPHFRTTSTLLLFIVENKKYGVMVAFNHITIGKQVRKFKRRARYFMIQWLYR